MTKKLNNIYPFLFAVFPVLSLYFHNVEQVDISEVLVPFAIVLGSTAFLLLLFKRALKSKEKPGIIVSLILLTIFSYGPLFSLFLAVTKATNISYFGPLYFTFWIALSITLSYFVITTKKKLGNLAKILSAVAVFLLVIPLISIGVYLFKTNTNKAQTKSEDLGLPTVFGAQTESEQPDIYYIILDRYANKETLKNVYGFDNSEFLDYLASQGFYVASESTSNYLKTAHSLASTLNMEYINYLSEELGESYTSWSPLYEKLEDYTVWRSLKSKGYKFIHLGDWWEPTTNNKFADENYNLYLLPEFSRVFYQSTILYPLTAYLGVYSLPDEHRDRIFYKFNKLSEISYYEEPTYTFAHMLVPHLPYIFSEDGSLLTEEEFEKTDSKAKYINQVIFVNKKIRELLDTLQSDKENQPIIIIQSDEGPFPQRYEDEGYNFIWNEATGDELKEKMGILNVLYLPGIEHDLLYGSITPVNTFRIIFNKYFGEELELLPDRNYAHSDEGHPYKLFEVTEKLR